jgi:phosphomethylpyrimidine synthase
MSYSTQMNAAQKGIVTPQMKQVLAQEQISESELLQRVADGRIVIPANKKHANLSARGVGAGLTTKINVNLGVSEDCCNIDMELEKVRKAIALKADAIMDLSTFGGTRDFRRRSLRSVP